MKRRGFISVIGSIASGFWPRRRTIITAMAALMLLPIETIDAGWLSDLFKGGSKQAKSTKQTKSTRHVASPKPAALAKPPPRQSIATIKLAALGPVALIPAAALKPAAPQV